MQKIQIAYGFKTISIGRLTIYTGKIRIKTSAQFLEHKLQNYLEHLSIYDCRNNCATISFEITSAILNNQLIDAINSILREMMHERIDAKYSRRTIEAIDYTDFLPY
jgi:hypothetical protein